MQKLCAGKMIVMAAVQLGFPETVPRDAPKIRTMVSKATISCLHGTSNLERSSRAITPFRR